MATELLTTRLKIPPETRHPVVRPTLLDTLDRDVLSHRMVSVSAPAGYGKTTLLAQWARRSTLPVAWFTVERDDNDPERFLRSLVLSWVNADQVMRESAVHLLVAGMNPDPDAVLAAFIEAGGQATSDVVFVLDDAHLIQDDRLRSSLTFLIDHLPPRLHMVVSGRRTPSLPIARYRARDELAEFHADDLKFGIAETRAFLTGRMGVQLDDDEIARLDASLEGWIAGLQLVSLSLRTSGNAGRSHELTGRHRFIADYLHEDVLAWLSDDARDVLIRTSILDQLCAPLCDAVLLRDDSQEWLEWLERENLFIEHLDENREWYRYHQLFADVLQQELRRVHPAEIGELHRRAAAWYLEHDYPDAAFTHALAGGDAETGIRVIDQYMGDLLNTGQLGVVQRWLDMTPGAWREKYPAIGVSDAAYLLVSGDIPAGSARLEETETRLRNEAGAATPQLLARVWAVRCYVSCFLKDIEQAEEYGFRALADLNEDDVAYRADIFHALGDTYRHYGQWDAARSAYLHVFDAAKPHVTPFREAHVYGALADLELMRGKLRSADAYWHRALDAIGHPKSQGLIPLAVIGWVHLRLGELLYERNDLIAAREHLEFGAKNAALGDDPRAQIAGAVLMARLRLTEGELDAATTLLDDSRALVDRSRSAVPDWVARFERCQLELWLAGGERQLAMEWVRRYLAGDSPAAELDRSIADLTACHVLMTHGDVASRRRAADLLDPILALASTEQRTGAEIEVLVIQALLYRRGGDDGTAMTSLERALRLAEPEGYVRLFVDFGLPMARLLQEARSRHVMESYVGTLLRAFGGDILASGGSRLPEPLSLRELEVLRLVAAGLTNEEIAGKLFISAETVKKHTGSIYGKLGVGNRIGAATRARELGLLDER